MSIDRRAQCRAWNADHAHQVAAGKTRAQAFTHEYQAAAGMAAFQSFSARMRAEHGSPQLFPQAAARYVAPEQIGAFAGRLPLPLQQIIHAAWAAGYGWGIDHWLGEPDERVPVGSLFALGDEHAWQGFGSGWFMCQVCHLAAFCPGCLPSWPNNVILCRLPQVLCDQHAGGG